VTFLGSGTVTLGDANTGTNSVALEANFGYTGNRSVLSNNIVVSPLGTGTVSIGTTSIPFGQAGTNFYGTITLNRDVTLVGGNGDRTSQAKTLLFPHPGLFPAITFEFFEHSGHELFSSMEYRCLYGLFPSPLPLSKASHFFQLTPVGRSKALHRTAAEQLADRFGA
jgi:hypothetical protein